MSFNRRPSYLPHTIASQVYGFRHTGYKGVYQRTYGSAARSGAASSHTATPSPMKKAVATSV